MKCNEVRETFSIEVLKKSKIASEDEDEVGNRTFFAIKKLYDYW